jgi:superfamily II DNA/RNA helicase
VHADDYVHRIGRTGRAGRSGAAITIVAGSNDAKAVAAIEKLIGQPIPFMDKIPGVASAPEQESSPPRERRDERRDERPRDRHHSSHRPAPAPVARIDSARPRRPAPAPRPRVEESDTSHLPAFLLRPVVVKA